MLSPYGQFYITPATHLIDINRSFSIYFVYTYITKAFGGYYGSYYFKMG